MTLAGCDEVGNDIEDDPVVDVVLEICPACISKFEGSPLVLVDTMSKSTQRDCFDLCPETGLCTKCGCKVNEPCAKKDKSNDQHAV